MENIFVRDRLQTVSAPARKLFEVIVRQARHGPLHPKPAGVATPPEILEACGLDVEEFYVLLNTLHEAGLIEVRNSYPFEEIRLAAQAVPLEDRYFEDYAPGNVYEFGAITVSESEIIEFARRFDPQSFHVDRAKAAEHPFGGIVASGWHTVCLTMRLLVDHYISPLASLGSPGVDEVRWPNPLRPGDSLSVRVTVLDARPSGSKPDRGIVRTRVEALNQNGELVLSMIAVSFLRRRPQA